MGAGTHLGINLDEYDMRIRTFIPGYEQLLEIASASVAATVIRRQPLIVDLGTGTGALAKSCLAARPSARIVGIDADAAMLQAAATRLRRRFTPVQGSFETIDLPACDAFTACLALHHIPTSARRLHMFRRIYRALRSGGALVIADCYLATNPRLRAADTALWVRHLRRRYSPGETARLFRRWGKEDVYAPLRAEIRQLERVGFSVDVPERRGPFAVVLAVKGTRAGLQ